jgi:ABC-type Mn2+/Zn2+ transport system permease subunit/copper chaperone CopZ
VFEWLTTPMHYEFFRHGIVAAGLVGATCGLIGVYIVLRKMSYIGHGLSHAVFGGAVVSYVMEWNFYLGAGLWGFLAALLINGVTKKKKIGADAAIGVVTTASFAVGVALISRYRRFTRNFDAALFGNILGVTTQDLWIILGVSLLTGLVVILFYKQFLFTTFDSDVAKVYGVRTDWIDSLFSLILAAVVIASMQVMGVTLIAAAIVVPAITARMLTDSFNKMVIGSVLIGLFSGVFGMYLSFYFNISSGATIVLFGALIFSISFVYNYFVTAWAPKEVPAESAPAAIHAHPHQHGGMLHVHEHGHRTPGETHHAGKGSAEEVAVEEAILTVNRMTCDTCVQTIEKAIGNLSGVSQVRIDLPTKKVRVAYYPKLISLSQIKNVLAQTGFG